MHPAILPAQWLNDETQVPKDDRVFFKTIAAKAPFISDVCSAAVQELGFECEFRFEGEAAEGLGAAHLLDSAAVSLPCRRFACDPVFLQVTCLDEEGLIEYFVPVCCLSSVDQVRRREKWLRDRLLLESPIGDGDELWSGRTLHFPRLIFCASTEDFVRSLSGKELHFRQILRHLTALNRYLLTWTDGEFALTGVDWSYESTATMNRAELAALRTFTCPDNVSRRFSPHTKLHGANLRIHFESRQDNRWAIDRDNRWNDCDVMGSLSTGGLFSVEQVSSQFR